ncbi:MAG: 4-hydroxybenzoate octaprenyltransferase [Pseudomonadota bacterium]
MALPEAPGPTSAPLTPDALSNHWSLRVLPGWARPYARLMRLERPVGWQLLFWPCALSSLLASIAATDGAIQWWHLGLFLLGAIIMRGAGCTLNDLVDRDLDSQVARTAARPIPSGEVSTSRALGFLIALLLVGFVILIQFNLFTIWLGVASLALVAIYPFMKRFTNWPQVVLGLVFAWGALVGWAAQTGAVDPPAIALYVACVVWIIGYDTLYAFQDIEDDELVGIGSTARALGTSAPTFVGFCYALTVALIAYALWAVDAGVLAYVGLFAGAVHFGWQIATLDLDDPLGCFRRFKSNTLAGALIAGGLMADLLTRSVMTAF